MTVNKLKAWFIAIILILNISPANAGGDYWSVKVQKKAVEADATELTFLMLEKPRGILTGCRSIIVHVKHELVPIWAWLPFVSTSHPTHKETINAIKFLNSKFSSKEDAYFGYIGGGVYKVDGEECTYESKGLRLEQTNDKHVVFSFYDPV